MPLLVLLFILVPLAELYVIIQVGQAIGLLPTLAILLGDALVGSFLLRSQGRAVWRRFNAALDERRFPGREAADGVMVAVGGTLLLTPGFLTDVVGLLLLLPPTRAMIRAALWRVLARRFRVVHSTAGWGYDRMRKRPGGGPHDVEGSAQEVPQDPGPDGPERPELPG